MPSLPSLPFLVMSALVLTACPTRDTRTERTQTWDDYRTAVLRWYPMAWGTPATSDVLADARRRFDCIWARDDDASRDFACVVSAMNENGPLPRGEVRNTW